MARIDSAAPPGRQTLLMNVLAAAVLAVLITAQALVDRREVLDDAASDVTNLSDALAEHTRQTLATLDLGLITLSREIGERGGLQSVSLRNLHEQLLERQAASPSTFAFFVIDVDGWLIGTSRSAASAPLHLADTPNYRHHRANADDRFFLSEPHIGRAGKIAGRWIIAGSRRLSGPDGEFAGVVGAVLSLDHLLEFYDTLRIGRDGMVGLSDGAGTLIARSPVADNLVGNPVFDPQTFARLFSREQGRFSVRYPADGIERVTGYHFVGDRQALVLVGLGRDELLAPWRKRLIFDIVLGVVVMSLFGLASSLLARHLARRRAWEENRAKRLGLLAQVSAELAQARDEDELLRRVTERSRELVGAHQALTSLTLAHDHGHQQSIRAVSLSDRYAQWRDYDEAPDGSGIYRLVCEHNQPVRMTQAELQAHPAWKGFGAAHERHPPLRGWLAVPIVSQEGRNLGLIQLSDKDDGEFTDVDTAEITQLANFASIALENLRSMRGHRDALAQIETIFNSISDGVAAVDTQWRFTYLNAEAERLLQRPRADLLGRDMWEAFPEGNDSPAAQVYRQAREENRPVSAEFYYAPLKTWFSVRAFPHPQGLTIYFQDVSQRIDTEEKLRQSQKMDAIGKLTGGVAHDFNNLLTVILGNADAVLEMTERDAVPPQVRKQVELIRVAGERAAELTHRLLAFARRQPLAPVETDINHLLVGFDDLLRRTLGERIEVCLICADDLWAAVVDPTELHNAILNLAINARDAMPEGGRLRIETANRALDAARARRLDLEPGEYVVVSVTDTGEGMPPDVVARAFEPFFTTKPPGKGSGLGLSMVYGFARQSGGDVRILSECGVGTTIRIYLPRARGTAVASPEPAPTQAGHGRGEAILLVEDDELVRQHTLNCLEQLGYRVTACAGGVQALAGLRDGGHWDLLLTDVKLADGMSGHDVAKSALECCPGLKVLYVSGYTDEAFKVAGGLPPGGSLLGKPFRMEELAHKLREMFDQ